MADALISAFASPQDAELAAQYVSSWLLFGQDGNDSVFGFGRKDGSEDRFSAEQMRAQTWWLQLPARHAWGIEAELYPLPDDPTDRWVHYVALADREWNGRIVKGSRLSAFFEGPDSYAMARAELQRNHSQQVGASVFHARTVEEAEAVLAADEPEGRGIQRVYERMAAARQQREAEQLQRGRVAGSAVLITAAKDGGTP